MIGLILGYLLGSFPTAYLLVRWRAGLDVRNAGSGNVGARNAYDVTGSGLLGAAIFLVDALKGAAAVALSAATPAAGFWTVCLGGVGALIGHNYSVWIRFRGGRGLAPAAGMFSIIAWPVVVFWCLVWAVSYAVVRQLHYANVAALILTPAFVPVLPLDMVKGPFLRGASVTEITLFSALCFIVILVRHIGPVKAVRKSSVH